MIGGGMDVSTSGHTLKTINTLGYVTFHLP